MAMSAISVESLSFSFGEKKLFDGLSFELPPGARCVLLGPNGVGKSTLLRILAGKHWVSEKQAYLLGKPVFTGHFPPEERGWVAERFPFELDISVGEILKHRLLINAVDTQFLNELLELLGIHLHWRMHQVSQGQRRRVDLFLSLLHRPQVLFLDEAISDLDLRCRQKVLNWLKREGQRAGMTILLATHLLEVLTDWATHVIYLSFGHLRFFGSIEEWNENNRLNEWLLEDEKVQWQKGV